jgi:hypothetical protein
LEQTRIEAIEAGKKARGEDNDSDEDKKKPVEKTKSWKSGNTKSKSAFKGLMTEEAKELLELDFGMDSDAGEKSDHDDLGDD